MKIYNIHGQWIGNIPYGFVLFPYMVTNSNGNTFIHRSSMYTLDAELAAVCRLKGYDIRTTDLSAVSKFFNSTYEWANSADL